MMNGASGRTYLANGHLLDERSSRPVVKRAACPLGTTSDEQREQRPPDPAREILSIVALFLAARLNVSGSELACAHAVHTVSVPARRIGTRKRNKRGRRWR